MPRTISFPFEDVEEEYLAPGDLYARLVGADGSVTAPDISTGFSSLGGFDNWFIWTGQIPDGFTGAVQILTQIDDRVLGADDLSEARRGDAMALTAQAMVDAANEIERQIIDDTDSEKVLKAFTDKLASVDPNLGDLSLSAIASSVKTAMEAGGGTLAAIKAKTDGAQQAGAAVTLPQSPPSGYGNGGTTPSAIADAVVNHAAPGDPQGATIGEAIVAAKLSGVSATQNSATLLTRASEVRLAKLDTVQQSGQPVTLPTAAPAGYAGLTNEQATQLSNLDGRITPARAAKLDGVAQVGSPMTLSNDGITTLAGYLERPSGLLALINMGVGFQTGMTELVAGGIRRLKASALTQAPGAGSGGSGSGGYDVPDINFKGATALQTLFTQSGRQILAIVINADGADYPVRLVRSRMYIGYTAAGALSAPAIPDCIEVTPHGDGALVQARIMIGTADGTETMPVLSLAPGTYKFWVWIKDVEIVSLSTVVVTVTA